jgi:predicted acetyltransferase
MKTMPLSMTEVVSSIPAEEIPGWARGMEATYLRDPEGRATRARIDQLARVWDPGRAWGARDRGRWVATLRTETRTLSVPGLRGATGDLRVDALTGVTVAATHRRRGLLSRMLGESLRVAGERGDPLSILIAAEWPIYGRFGYAPATLGAHYALHRSRSGATCPGDPARVRQVSRDEFGDVAPEVYGAARRARVGQVDRENGWWDRVLGRDGYTPAEDLPHNWLIHEGDDGPDGLLAWKAIGDVGLLPPLGTVKVWDLAAATDAAYRNLWSYLSGIDLVDEVLLSDRPVDEPVRWLLDDARTLVMTEQVDFLWLRLLDVPGALTARRYAMPGEVILEVIDENVPGFAAGCYRLRAEDAEVECERTNADPDVQMTQRALASIYLGGFRLTEMLLSGAARERTPGAVAKIDLMFSTPRSPWNATWF